MIELARLDEHFQELTGLFPAYIDKMMGVTCSLKSSTLKTDMDLTRFPSDKFATTHLILNLEPLTYNMHREIKWIFRRSVQKNSKESQKIDRCNGQLSGKRFLKTKLI